MTTGLCLSHLWTLSTHHRVRHIADAQKMLDRQGVTEGGRDEWTGSGLNVTLGRQKDRRQKVQLEELDYSCALTWGLILEPTQSSGGSKSEHCSAVALP